METNTPFSEIEKLVKEVLATPARQTKLNFTFTGGAAHTLDKKVNDFYMCLAKLCAHKKDSMVKLDKSNSKRYELFTKGRPFMTESGRYGLSLLVAGDWLDATYTQLIKQLYLRTN